MGAWFSPDFVTLSDDDRKRFCNYINDGLLASGFVRLNDTGQIDFATIPSTAQNDGFVFGKACYSWAGYAVVVTFEQEVYSGSNKSVFLRIAIGNKTDGSCSLLKTYCTFTTRARASVSAVGSYSGSIFISVSEDHFFVSWLKTIDSRVNPWFVGVEKTLTGLSLFGEAGTGVATPILNGAPNCYRAIAHTRTDGVDAFRYFTSTAVTSPLFGSMILPTNLQSSNFVNGKIGLSSLYGAGAVDAHKFKSFYCYLASDIPNNRIIKIGNYEYYTLSGYFRVPLSSVATLGLAVRI